MSGRGTATKRSNRPGRLRAGSSVSARLVAATTITPSLDSNPSCLKGVVRVGVPACVYGRVLNGEVQGDLGGPCRDPPKPRPHSLFPLTIFPLLAPFPQAVG